MLVVQVKLKGFSICTYYMVEAMESNIYIYCTNLDNRISINDYSMYTYG
jgi:hypothetical protein